MIDLSIEETLENAIAKGIDMLFKSQLRSGEFTSYMFNHDEAQSNCVVDPSVFPSSLIAYSLRFVVSDKSRKMQESVAKFLQAQMLSNGLWRYWTKEHPQHKVIPADVDDTVCASIILEQQQIPHPANKSLLLANSDSRGVLYTWFAPRWYLKPDLALLKVVFKQALDPIKLYYFWKTTESGTTDLDSVVNANALYYLGNSDETRLLCAPIIEYLNGVVLEGKEETSDKWHQSRFNLYYAISRCAFHNIEPFDSIRQVILERILERTDGDGIIGDNILETALALCTMQNFGYEMPGLGRSIEAILESQKEDGSWIRLPMYFGGPKKTVGWGSEELTTGFCLEALSRLST